MTFGREGISIIQGAQLDKDKLWHFRQPGINGGSANAAEMAVYRQSGTALYTIYTGVTLNADSICGEKSDG